MANETNEADLVAQLDQMLTNNENIAKLMASYYKTLKAEGLPATVAKQLTLDFHNSFWEKIYYPNGRTYV